MSMTRGGNSKGDEPLASPPPKTPTKAGWKHKSDRSPTPKSTSLGSPFKADESDPSPYVHTKKARTAPSSAGASKNVDDNNDDPFAPFIAKDDTNNIMDLNNITVKLLPNTCKVTLNHVKDPHLISIGHYDNLPNLKLCGLMSWKTLGQAKKHETKVMSVRSWMKCIPTLNKAKLVQGLTFARSGDYYNPSVADPRDFEGVWVKTKHFAKHKIHMTKKPCLVAGISIIGVTESCLRGLADTRL
ncbi:hypothetical protein FA15DRAFT_658318 [Coprinopsis marcescibilis]|uniref:Uncharacterized protein n=1 Tax=Coprinopsis marcescibilis TaxID=230819 RepID=A0A5C3KLZ1_COPMA|nr:hypothetical protein FA15DRAFT_658318 [Coprinopsis marcescibilis]